MLASLWVSGCFAYAAVKIVGQAWAGSWAWGLVAAAVVVPLFAYIALSKIGAVMHYDEQRRKWRRR